MSRTKTSIDSCINEYQQYIHQHLRCIVSRPTTYTLVTVQYLAPSFHLIQFISAFHHGVQSMWMLYVSKGYPCNRIGYIMQRKFIKEKEIGECVVLAMFRHLLCSTNKFRCIQSCDTLHLQKSACLCNDIRLIVYRITFSDSKVNKRSK